MIKLVLVILCSSLSISNGARRLEQLSIDPSGITVSGLSAGGAFAVQFHYAFSREISGVGIFAGLPYSCAYDGGLPTASLCMYAPDYSTPVDTMITQAEKQSDDNSIDKIEYLKGDRAFIFHGKSDYTVFIENERRIREMYQHFEVEVQSEISLPAAHGLPTDHYGASCSLSSGSTQYINNCGYKGVYHMLDYIYGGGLEIPDNTVPPTGDFFEFDQSEFFSGSQSLDSIGFAYVPKMCMDKSIPCKLHIAFHGCQQSRSHSGVGDAFATKTGYLQAGELNNIVMLFPQAIPMGTTNPNACLDWWGYLNKDFINKSGPQMKAVHDMMRRIIAG